MEWSRSVWKTDQTLNIPLISRKVPLELRNFLSWCCICIFAFSLFSHIFVPSYLKRIYTFSMCNTYSTAFYTSIMPYEDISVLILKLDTHIFLVYKKHDWLFIFPMPFIILHYRVFCSQDEDLFYSDCPCIIELYFFLVNFIPFESEYPQVHSVFETWVHHDTTTFSAFLSDRLLVI